MQSHTYQIRASDCGRLLLQPLATLLAIGALLRIGVWTGILPDPRPRHDVDQTILVHQADASRTRSQAAWLLCGDSSCLMDVQARLLSEALEAECLNLGMFSFLNLDASTWLLEEFCRVNPDQLQWVVVLMHPEALRQANPDPYTIGFLRNYLQGLPPPPKPGLTARFQDFLGLTEFRNRLLDRYLPAPLLRSFGRYYGFTSDLERYLTRNHGSAVDLEARPFRGNPEYYLAPTLEKASQDFRNALPKGVRLVIGITPIPESFAPPNYSERFRELLIQWDRWIQADHTLQTLPCTLPDALFVKTTHLNARGAAEYTRRLATALQEAQLSTRDPSQSLN